MMRLSETVKHLIIINVIFFLASQIPSMQEALYTKLSLFYPENPNFGIWQLVTSMFMHGGFMHILFNMIALASVGSPLEYIWGRNKFLIFYFVTGIGAGLIYTAVHYFQFHQTFDKLLALGMSHADVFKILKDGTYSSSINAYVSSNELNQFYSIYNSTAVGASGAIYGVLVAFAFKFPDAKMMIIPIPVPIKAKYLVMALIAFDLFSGLNGQSLFGNYGTGIAHFAHIGGALIGYLLLLYYNKHEFRRWN